MEGSIMKKLVYVRSILVVALCLIFASSAWSGNKPRRPAIIAGADRVLDLQRTDSGWEGTWYWYVGSTYNATNLTGVTALGLIEAYNDTKDTGYLDGAKDAADFIMTHLGAGATGTQYWPRTTAFDVIFLHELATITDDGTYGARATLEWNNIILAYPTAGDLDGLFRAINRRSAWDLAAFHEAAYLSGDTVWADESAGILADTSDDFYYGDTWWYALNLSASVRALVGTGYFAQYSGDIVELYNLLRGLVSDNGIDGYIQDTAYAVMAFNTVGGEARKVANMLGRWLANQQEASGGWLEAGYEYPEADGEAVRALAHTIGSNITIDGFEPGNYEINSSWRRAESTRKAEPFSE